MIMGYDDTIVDLPTKNGDFPVRKLLVYQWIYPYSC